MTLYYVVPCCYKTLCRYVEFTLRAYVLLATQSLYDKYMAE
jgi:hypothetical protein